MINWYIAAFVMSFLLCVILIFMMRRNRSIYYVFIFISVVISNAGYLAVAASTVVEEALLGFKFTFVLGCFMPLFTFLIIVRACKLELPKFIVPLLTFFSCFVMGLAMTSGYNDIYYYNIQLHQYDGISYLTKEYGPYHMAYYVIIALYIVLNFIPIVYSLRKQEVFSYKNILIVFSVELLIVSVYLFERAIGLKLEIMPFACVLAQMLTLILIRRLSMYDISLIVSSTIDHMEENGYIVFDSNKRYIGSNQRAQSFLPELADLKIDYPITKKQEFLYSEVLGIIEVCERMPKFFKKAHYITRDDVEIKCTLKHILHGRKQEWIGYVMELSDDTIQQKYIRLLNNYNNELEEAVEEKIAHIREMQNKMIAGIADIVENRDSSTGGHIKRTSAVMQVFVEELREKSEDSKLTEKFCEDLIKAAPMHDLGKIAVDDYILKKPGKYTCEEFEAMKEHAVAGRHIVETVLKDVEEKEFIELAVNVANYHHERWDGYGYPKQLKGEAIPVEARIMALADVFDVLVSKRCYKEKMSFDEAFKIIEESLGTHFDPVLGKHFIACRPKLEKLYEGIE